MVMRRVLALVCSLTFALPLLSLWPPPAAGRSSLALIVAMAVITAASPPRGLLLFAGLFPLAFPLALLVDQAALTEGLLLSFLAAGALRLALDRDVSRGQLDRPAALFLLVIAASSAITLSTLQQHVDDAGPFVAELGRHLVGDFFAPGRFEPVHEFYFWFEAIGLAVVAEHLLRRNPGTGPAAVRMLVVSGGGLAAFSGLRLAEIALRSDTPLATAASVVGSVRFNPFYPDLNAAGSLYALLLVPAAWLAWTRRQWWAAGAAVLLGLALWLAGSRAAVAATIASLGVVWLLANRPSRRAVMVVACASLIAVAVATGWSTRNLALDRAAAFRVELARAALLVTARAPLFGVGLNQFKPLSGDVLSEDFRTRYAWAAQGENAHNNFLQVLAELGLVGLAAFVWCLVPLARNLARHATVGDPRSAEVLGAAGGVLAFVLSALFGHPLLLPHVRDLFFLALGIAVAVSSGSRIDQAPAGRWSRLGLLPAVVILAALPFRVTAERRATSLDGVFYGASDPAGPLDGIGYRVAAPHSTWFLPPEARTVQVPLRLAADSVSPCRVSVTIDGRAADEVAADRENWHPLDLQLVPTRNTGWRRLDLTVPDDRCRLLVGAFRVRP